MTPAQLAASGTESGHQRALFALVNAAVWQLACQHAAEGNTTANPHAKADQWDGVDRRWASPLAWLHSIPNGGSRGDSVRSRAIRGATMKAEGVKEGIPDVFLPYPILTPTYRYAGLYIEMKKPGVKKASKEQEAFRDYAHSVGYAWELCNNWERAYEICVEYLRGSYVQTS